MIILAFFCVNGNSRFSPGTIHKFRATSTKKNKLTLRTDNSRARATHTSHPSAGRDIYQYGQYFPAKLSSGKKDPFLDLPNALSTHKIKINNTDTNTLITNKIKRNMLTLSDYS